MPLNHQETFDTMLTHLRKQGQRAVDQTHEHMVDTCMYRTSSGLKCAVGCLIPDDLYDRRMEGSDPAGLVDDGFISDWDAEDVDFLKSAQTRLHDRLPEPAYAFSTALEKAAKNFAADFKLEYKEH
jgi:hypothetical protein